MKDYSDKFLILGAGKQITPAAAILAKMIKMQDKTELPRGLVLKDSGAKPRFKQTRIGAF